MRCPKWDRRSELAVKYCCPSAAATVVSCPRFVSYFPIASSQICPDGPVKLLCRYNLALSTDVSSVMCPSKAQL
jgi:hypothetical protein